MQEDQKQSLDDQSLKSGVDERTKKMDLSQFDTLGNEPQYDEDLESRPLIFDNVWHILERLGEGGMSVVYKARHLDLNRLVAIKVLLPHLTSNTKNLQRFRQEAVTASSLNHPNLIHVENFGQTPDGRTFIIMDFVEGESLSELLAKERKLDPIRALFIFVQAANALQHAHERNVIHRDLKPSNIMLIKGDEGESVKIVDFGIAKLLLDDDDQMQHLTQTGEVFGSPVYMSPEQCRGEKLDARSDIYSFGVLMYETLAGHPPLKGTNVLDTMQKHLYEQPNPLVEGNAPDSLLKRLNVIVLKAMDKERGSRYKSMLELQDDLNSSLLAAEKDWRQRSKLLQRKYKNLKSQKKVSPKMVATVSLSVFALLISGYLTFREVVYDPAVLMNFEKNSLYSTLVIPKTSPESEGFSQVAEHMSVVRDRDVDLWERIEKKIVAKTATFTDYKIIDTELIPNTTEAAKFYKKNGKWDAAIRSYALLIDINKKLSQENAAEFVSFYKALGEIYLVQGRYALALEKFNNADKIGRKGMTANTRSEVLNQLLFARVRICVHEKKYDVAEDIGQKYLDNERAKRNNSAPNSDVMLQ
ncbi:MAG: protein kinase, partial [Leptolyngbya sp.]|nr:protein kinase [Candidatus Melainabacteria bacterium]